MLCGRCFPIVKAVSTPGWNENTELTSLEINPNTPRITLPISPSLWPICTPISAPSTKTSFNSPSASFFTPALWWCKLTRTSSSVRPRREVGIVFAVGSSWSALRDLRRGFWDGRAMALGTKG